ARQAGCVAGMRALDSAIDEMDARLALELLLDDGAAAAAGDTVATLAGNVRDLLTCERVLLNLLGRLMGIATLTRQYVDLVAGTKCRVYDTRKTTPGWRRMEKYAVRCGGGVNHRNGLYDAVLIKDNHLAQLGADAGAPADPGDAVRLARDFLASARADRTLSEMIVEIEVDSLEQCAAALAALPDIVLLDNMSLDELRAAVALRNQLAPEVELEASGGVRLETVRAIAETGVERVSVGGLTHSAAALDVGLDYLWD
ncbi:MAG TPA: carboxylating nicotinate-nucleotide diphosphorylase, partial [Lacipirellulaceae bacterium]|nr:carboxylating nicotinate-nucleotide diphosphorylase [Lacipirellulaceae bacterium]